MGKDHEGKVARHLESQIVLGYFDLQEGEVIQISTETTSSEAFLYKVKPIRAEGDLRASTSTVKIPESDKSFGFIEIQEAKGLIRRRLKLGLNGEEMQRLFRIQDAIERTEEAMNWQVID